MWLRGLPTPLQVVCTKGRSFTLFPDRTIEFEHPSMCRLVVLECDFEMYDLVGPVRPHGKWSEFRVYNRPDRARGRFQLQVLDPLDNSTRWFVFEVIRFEFPDAVAAA